MNIKQIGTRGVDKFLQDNVRDPVFVPYETDPGCRTAVKWDMAYTHRSYFRTDVPVAFVFPLVLFVTERAERGRRRRRQLSDHLAARAEETLPGLAGRVAHFRLLVAFADAAGGRGGRAVVVLDQDRQDLAGYVAVVRVTQCGFETMRTG